MRCVWRGHTGHSSTIFSLSPHPQTKQKPNSETQPQTPAQGGTKSHMEPSDCQDSFLERRLEQDGKQRKEPPWGSPRWPDAAQRARSWAQPTAAWLGETAPARR